MENDDIMLYGRPEKKEPVKLRKESDPVCNIPKKTGKKKKGGRK